jgi:heavy metal sensor kinase
MNPRSLHFRLILWYSGLVIVVLLAFAAYTYEGVRVRIYGEMEKTLARRAQQIADNVLPHAGSETPQEIARQIREVYSPAANSRFIRILKSDGKVLYVSEPPKDGRFDPLTVPMPSAGAPLQRTQALPSGVALLMVDLPVTVSGTPYRIEMGAPASEMQTVMHGLVVTLLLGLPVVLIIVSAGGYVLVRRSLMPVEDIRATAEKITFGNLSSRLPVAATGDALEHLSVTLNQMLARLEDAYLQVSRFSADASHELRTPLSIMRAELESIVQRESGLPEPLRERIGSLLEEAERLSHIAESLFAISRLDAGEANAMATTFDLAELVRTTTDQMLLLAEVKSIRVHVEAAHPVRVTGAAAKLKQVVVNLLDNAIKYTPDGGRIVIAVTALQHKAVLSVADTGIGIAPEALPHVFERFYRADKARTREQGGAGLGLAIVRSICQAHSGSIDIESMENSGTICRVALPLAEAQG